jgi:metal-responsive CopG/Arc/MetJ family transcriptional regulator
MRAKYATVKIPQELASRLDEFVSDMGYRSRAEIVNDAIRRFIDERRRLDNHVAANESDGPSRNLKRNELIKLTP